MSDALPTPAGVGGHLRYTWQALRRIRRLGRELDALDEELRTAVRRRDEQLARVGEAALADAGRAQGGRLSAFAGTIEEQAAEHARTEVRRAELEATLERVEAEREATLTAALERVEAARETQAALDKVAADARRAVERATEEEAVALSDLRETAEHAAEAVRGAKETLASLQRERDRARSAQDAEVEAAREALGDARRLAERAAARHQATLVDLGREVLRTSAGGEGTRADAQQALSEIEELRARHTETLRARDAIDTAPVARTIATALAGVALVGVALLLL